MSTSTKILDNQLREKWVANIMQHLADNGEEVLRVGTSEIAIPCVDAENNDKFIVFTIKVPTGSRDGDAYDGYSMAEDYQIKKVEKEEKAKIQAEKKAKKIAKDEKKRKQLAEAKAKHTTEKEG